MNKLIDIYDGLFSYDDRSTWLTSIYKSLFTCDGSDSSFDLYPSVQIFSSYSELDLQNLKFCNSEGFQFLNKKYNLSNRKIRQVRVNLSTLAEKNSPHSDGQGLTLIYYPHLQWDISWGGHTLFLNEDLSDVYKLCLYKPGRVVIFDGTIPHMIVNPTVLCPVNRLSFAIQYTPELC